MITYKCSKCGLPVKVNNGEIARSCDHTGAAVIADCKATCKGTSKVN